MTEHIDLKILLDECDEIIARRSLIMSMKASLDYIYYLLYRMPVKKIVKTKKAPAYQPDEEYLHNLVVAEVAVQLAKRDSDILRELDERGIGVIITQENEESHYFTAGDIIMVFIIALLWGFLSWALFAWSL